MERGLGGWAGENGMIRNHRKRGRKFRGKEYTPWNTFALGQSEKKSLGVSRIFQHHLALVCYGLDSFARQAMSGFTFAFAPRSNAKTSLRMEIFPSSINKADGSLAFLSSSSKANK